MRKEKKTLDQLINENKEELLNDKKALERIEKRIEERHEQKSWHESSLHQLVKVQNQ